MNRKQRTPGGSWHRRRFSRRRLLGGALAMGAGAAGLALTGCAEEEEVGPGTPEATPEATPTGLEPVQTRGGHFRTFEYDAMALDTFDPYQTQFGPLYNTHGSIFSKVLQYDDEVEQVMSPDLCAGPDGGPGMPEQPDEQTYIIRIRPNVFFHDTPQIRENYPQVAGRQLTAEDVKYSIERQVNPDSPQSALYYRRYHWETVDKIELVDDLTLRITTKGRIAPFLHYLADRNAFIIAKELVDENDEMNHQDRMIGSGPFILEKFEALQTVQVVRNPNWFGADDRPELGTGRPFLDMRETMWTPESDVVVETAFKTKQIDRGGFGDLVDTFRVADEVREAYVVACPQSGGPGTRFLIDRPPFDDLRRRRAFHLAIDRQTLGEQFWHGPPDRPHFYLSGPVAWMMRRWAIPQEDLLKKPGYRFSTAEREEDIAEAKKLWEAAGGTEAVGSFKMIFAGVPGFIPNVALPQTVRMLKEVLGVDVETEVDPTGYTTLAACTLRNIQGAASGTCESVWGYDNGWIDLDDWLYPYFRTGGAKNSYRLSDPKVDELLDAQRIEFDYEKRRQIGLELQHYLLDEVNADLKYGNQNEQDMYWNYVRNPWIWNWYGSSYLFANTWIDQNAPSYAGRPT
ncbi:MAG: ABC transporter substrate-binding protein [Dehalococcoidia bacterium]